MPQVGPWHVRPLRRSDHEHWVRLFEGYATFYERNLTTGQLATVWNWVFEDQTTVALVVTEGPEGPPVGLAHLRSWRRPLWAAEHGYLDDLFVAPEARGTGAVHALFAAIGDLARDRGWAVVRWTTAADNYRAQAVYDRYAERTSWVTYDATAGLAGGGQTSR
jgi:RimJ/RimL family protein N-acetyltransferase